MKNFLNQIKLKIINNLKPEELSIVDNSYLHTKHKSFDASKFHLKIIIKSNELKKIGKINAHKMIYSILKDEIDTKIHALEIDIK